MSKKAVGIAISVLPWLLAFVFIGALIIACLVYFDRAQLRAVLEPIRAAGEPLTVQDLVRPPIPADQNAAAFLKQAQPDIVAVHKRLEPILYQQAFSLTGELNPEDATFIETTLAARPRLMPLLTRAAQCPDCNFDIDLKPQYGVTSVSFPDFLFPARDILRAYAYLQIAHGNPQQALETW